jgi:hypothetical protein
VWAPDGDSRQEPLIKGEYKSNPNNVLQADGVIHEYAPVMSVGPEMQVLFREIESDAFQRANAILQAAYAHHSLASIHPFQDGNGRMSRAIGSVFTYRAISVPLLLFSDSRDEYYDALAAADDGAFETLVAVVFRAGITALDLVHQSLKTAKRPGLAAAAGSLRSVGLTAGGYSHFEVERATTTILFELRSQLEQKSLELRAYSEDTEWKVKTAILPPDEASTHEGYRPAKLVEKQVLSCIATHKQGGLSDSTVVFNFRAHVPVDCQIESSILILCDHWEQTKAIPVRSLLQGSVAIAAQMNLSMWIDEVITFAMENLSNQVRKKLMKAGVTPASGT